MEGPAIDGESPVREKLELSLKTPEYRRTRVIRRESGRTIFQG
jgi:hypothetical protein